jgi:hypothetical protein
MKTQTVSIIQNISLLILNKIFIENSSGSTEYLYRKFIEQYIDLPCQGVNILKQHGMFIVFYVVIASHSGHHISISHCIS